MQGFASAQSAGEPALQTPSLHRSPTVHRLPSSQVPSIGAGTQAPPTHVSVTHWPTSAAHVGTTTRRSTSHRFPSLGIHASLPRVSPSTVGTARSSATSTSPGARVSGKSAASTGTASTSLSMWMPTSAKGGAGAAKPATTPAPRQPSSGAKQKRLVAAAASLAQADGKSMRFSGHAPGGGAARAASGRASATTRTQRMRATGRPYDLRAEPDIPSSPPLGSRAVPCGITPPSADARAG